MGKLGKQYYNRADIALSSTELKLVSAQNVEK